MNPHPRPPVRLLHDEQEEGDIMPFINVNDENLFYAETRAPNAC
jgi:hypothetical protein